MRVPFSYFGNKWRIAPAIWERLGNPTHYFEPFAGALGCLLRRPSPGKHEYVGDIDAQITNFWLAAASPRLKIALCGYEGNAPMPDDWEQLAWGSQAGKGRERIWFSPHCQQKREAA